MVQLVDRFVFMDGILIGRSVICHNNFKKLKRFFPLGTITKGLDEFKTFIIIGWNQYR